MDGAEPYSHPRFNRDLPEIIEDMGLPLFTPAAQVHAKLQETKKLYEVKDATRILFSLPVRTRPGWQYEFHGSFLFVSGSGGS